MSRNHIPGPANHKIGLMQRSTVNLAHGENTCKINFTRNNFIINNNLTQSVSNVVKITPVKDVTITTRRTSHFAPSPTFRNACQNDEHALCQVRFMLSAKGDLVHDNYYSLAMRVHKIFLVNIECF